MVCSSPAADDSSGGSAVTNDMCSSQGKQAYPEAGRDYRGALMRPKTGDAPAKLQYILFGVMYTINQTSSLQLHAMHA
jgi:hypothetical protein